MFAKPPIVRFAKFLYRDSLLKCEIGDYCLLKGREEDDWKGGKVLQGIGEWPRG
jgi:hypothetical protein